MYHYIVWMSIEGVSVGFPLVAWVPLSAMQQTAIGNAIAAGAGQQFLYVEAGDEG